MYCANCGKTFGKYERRTYTVLPGRVTPVPTCYHDRLCYARYRVLPTVAIKLVIHNPSVFLNVPRKTRVKDNARGLAKYLRKYKFKGR